MARNREREPARLSADVEALAASQPGGVDNLTSALHQLAGHGVGLVELADDGRLVIQSPRVRGALPLDASRADSVKTALDRYAERFRDVDQFLRLALAVADMQYAGAAAEHLAGSRLQDEVPFGVSPARSRLAS